MGRGNMQSVILLVDKNLAWYHFSTATALWSDDFDVQLFAAVYVETKKIKDKQSKTRYLSQPWTRVL